MDGQNSESVTAAQPLDYDEVFDLLATERRRVALHIIEEQGIMPESQLVDLMTRWEIGDDYSEQERKRLLISWGQSHADRLEETGVIVRNDSHVALGPHAPLLLQHIRDSEERQRVRDLLD